MDHPEISEEQLIKALCEIRWVNRHLGGTAAILDEFKKMKIKKRSFTVLDLGTGSADIPKALADWGRSRYIKIRSTAVDLNPTVVLEAQRLCTTYPEISCMQGDALNLPFTEASFDYVISSMFMHHLPHQEAITLLKEMARISKLGFAVNELERHPIAWLGIKLLGHLTKKSPMFMNDASLSVLKGFTRTELQKLCKEAGLSEFIIKRRHPFRWVVTWRK